MIHEGDVREVLPCLADQSVQCVVTSPPYWGLRDYGVEGQLGLEATPEAYVETMVAVFREVRRVLRDDGTVFLNLGDSYARDEKKGQHKPGDSGKQGYIYDNGGGRASSSCDLKSSDLKPKDLVGIPWMLAFALRSDGWYLRSDIIWAKGYSFHPTTAGSCMPESVRDRPTRGHEYVFLLTKSARYYYDADAVREDGIFPAGTRAAKGSGTRQGNRRGQRKKDQTGTRGPSPERTQSGDFQDRWDDGYATYSGKRNLRSVWLINPKPFKAAHFATFPTTLVEPMIKAGTKPGDTVLDPFAGSGTVGLVCQSLGRQFVGIELNEDYCALAERRLAEG